VAYCIAGYGLQQNTPLTVVSVGGISFFTKNLYFSWQKGKANIVKIIFHLRRVITLGKFNWGGLFIFKFCLFCGL
jgi:hypothetical protein